MSPALIENVRASHWSMDAWYVQLADLIGLDQPGWLIMASVFVVIGGYMLFCKLLCMATDGVRCIYEDSSGFPAFLLWILWILLAIIVFVLNFGHTAIAVAGINAKLKEHLR